MILRAYNPDRQFILDPDLELKKVRDPKHGLKQCCGFGPFFRIRIRESGFENTDPDPDPDPT